MTKSFKLSLAALALAAGFAASAQAGDITGAGATFVYPALSKWSADYNKATGHEVNYQSIGSGGGIAQIKAKTVDFGSSDAPMKPAELAQFGLGQFPSVVGGVVPIVNLKGIAPGAIRFTGPLLAGAALAGASCGPLDAVWLSFSAGRHAATAKTSAANEPREIMSVGARRRPHVGTSDAGRSCRTGSAAPAAPR